MEVIAPSAKKACFRRTMKHFKKKLAQNLTRLREEIASACRRSGRKPAEVTLVAVTKSVGLDVIRALAEIGQMDLAENRPAELFQRASMLAELSQRARQSGGLANQDAFEQLAKIRWHMVGHLQRNKVNTVLNCSHIIHSVDNLRLAEDIDAKARKRGITADVLLEVNCSGESSKFGVPPAAVNHLAKQFETLENIRLLGLMTMGPLATNPEDSRPTFVRLRELLEEMHAERYVSKQCRHLSMGTTQDYTVAIEEGATMVRLGRALFDGLYSSDRP